MRTGQFSTAECENYIVEMPHELTDRIAFFLWGPIMNEYILLMFNDAIDFVAAGDNGRWDQYIATLRKSGRFDGGSSIGVGERLKKGQLSQLADSELTGFLRVRAKDLDDAKSFLVGNPTYEAGGTVEVRELPKN